MKTWISSLKGYLNPAVFIFFFLGFSCGIPYSLIGYSLSLWLSNVGTSLAVIGFFALVLLPYNFKFLWAPFVDRIEIPYLAKKIGGKKAWLIIFQIGLILSIISLSYFSPDKNTWAYTLKILDEKTGENLSVIIPLQTYIFAFLTAFFAASQDIVVDALRINTLKKEEFGEGAGMYQYGYRMGMLLAGAGVVAISSIISWELAYFYSGLFIIIGVVSVFFIKETEIEKNEFENQNFFKKMIVAPFQDFMKRMNWAWILVFIILYKLCNAILGRMALPFYSEMGFSNAQIALVSGTIGPWITILGVIFGGVLVMKYQIYKLLLVLGFVEILTSIVFALFSFFPGSISFFLLVILFDNVVGGMGGAVFVAFLSGLCSKKFSATQYALLTSLMMLAVSCVSVYSGVWAEEMGWFTFFVFTGILMIPALVLLLYLIKENKKLEEMN